MKKLLIIAIAAISFVACQQKNYTINGTIEGVAEGQAILQTIEGGRPAPKDTAVVTDGKFTFTGVEDEAQLYLIFIDDNRAPIVFFGENANITITADAKELNKAKITGSKNTDIYTSFIDGIPSKDRMEVIQGEYQQAMGSGNQEAIAAIQKEVEEIMEKQKAYFIQFVKNNTTNVVGANMALQAASEFELDEFKALITSFEASLGEHKYVAALKDIVEPMEKAAEAKLATEIGAVAPDFTLKTADGADIALSSLKGNYVLVDFWASWCKPCREENPNVVKAYNEYKAKGFDVLSVSLDRDEEAWKKAIDEDGLSWTQLIDGTGDVANTYGIQSIPFTLLLDKEGKIVAKNLRGEELEAKLAELLN
ncbi:TlpA disulfide reductase family protein [Saccharicrinis aurantiacus]|uniref:TlpA disulfide reductase family protein n=1 Tax=Saccharicrinis aurantiacus TaxID=1849719 RepID=UPI000837AFB2|nr:TlpA disulfide reductase family protein [Saccharicrinis aurantiacus]